LIWYFPLFSIPDYAPAYNNWGYLLFEFHKYKEGVELIKKAIRLDPKEASFYISLAEGFLKIGKNKEAIVRLKQAVRLAPKNPEAYRHWAEALVKLKKYNKAFEKYQKAKELESH